MPLDVKNIQGVVGQCTDTTANWEEYDSVIPLGLLCIEKTVEGFLKLKIGDGVKTFTQLEYYPSAGEPVPVATETVYGIVQRATVNEMIAAIDGVKYISSLAHATYHNQAGNHNVPEVGPTNDGQFLQANSGTEAWVDITPEMIGAATDDHTHGIASDVNDGFMSVAEHMKLAGIADGATNYTHPATHPATMITQDETHRMVSDVQISAWDGKQDVLGFVPENSANKNAVNGYAGLDSNGKLYTSQVPSIAITDVFEAASESAMLALSNAQRGDICVRSDLSKSFILSTDSYSTLADWKELKTPSDVVISVNGQTGAVVLAKGDIGLGNVDNTSDVNKPISTATQTALNGKVNTSRTINSLPLTGDIVLTTANIDSATDKRYLTDAQLTIVSNTSGTNTGDETTASLGTKINNATAKTTPVDADTMPIADSAASFVMKKVTWANIKATLKTYFDTLYNKYVHPNHSGDVTSVADGATTIAAKVVTNSKLADVSTATIKGRTTAGTGSPEDLTAAQVRTLLNVEDGANAYVHPSTHAATMIVEDATHRFATDAEKLIWNGKPDLGETSATAYRGDRGKIAYDHSQVAHAPANAQKNSDILKSEIEAVFTGTITSHDHSSISGNAATATKLATARTINGVSFDGTANITVADSTKQPLDADLTAIAALTGTSGFLKKTAANTWALDTSSYALSVHTHAATDITQDATHRMVSDTQITAWTAKQDALGYTPENAANKNVANGYAGLDANGKLLEAQLPALAITDTFTAASQAAMLALSTAQKGDVCVRSDLNKTYILSVDGYATLANWVELKTPTDAVLSVAGRTGAIVLTKSDVGLDQVDNTSDVNKPVSTATQTALNGKVSTTTTVNGLALSANITLTTANIADSTDKRYVTDAKLTVLNNTSGTNTGDETQTTLGTKINAATEKTTPVDADLIPIADSAASFIMKKLTWANLKATLKTYFDTLYNKYVHPNHTGEVTSAADGAQTIASNVVTNAKLATVATGTIKGRATAATGNVEDLTAAQVRTLLNVADGATALALGETSTTAYRGDRGASAYAHSISAHAPSDAQKNSDITKAEIEAKLIDLVASHWHNLANMAEKSYNSLDDKPNIGAIARETFTLNCVTGVTYLKFAETPVDPVDWYGLFRVTVSSTVDGTIFHEMFIEVAGHKNAIPTWTIDSKTNNSTAATSGIQVLRATYPKTVGNGYKSELELYCGSAVSRDIKIEVIESKNLTFLSALAASAYNSTYQNVTSSTVMYNGIISNGTVYAALSGSLSGNASTSTASGNLYTSGYVAGEALVANDLVFLQTDNKWYKALTANAQIPLGAVLGRSGGAYAAAATATVYLQGFGSVPTGKTGVVGKDVYVRGQISGTVLISDGTMSSTLDAGYSYMRFASCVTSTILLSYDGNNRVYTIDANGKITAMDGVSFAQDDLVTSVAGRTGAVVLVTNDVTESTDKLYITAAERIAWNAKQAALGYTPENVANKGVANGYAGLDSSGKIPEAYLPSIAITDTFTAASDTAMIALSSARKGDVCIRTDLNKTYILAADGYATLSNWKELKTPTDLVLSVAGRTGVVVLTKADVGLSNVDNTSDANKPVSTAQQAALDLKTDKSTTVNGYVLESNVFLTTSDIPSSTDKRYLTDAQVAQVNNTSGINTGNETVTSIGNLVNAATAKPTPVDADLFAVFDSVASFITRKISFAQLKAAFKTYFDGLYNMYVHPNHTGEVVSTGDGATTIATNIVTNTKLAQVATGTIKGRAAAGTGNVEDLSASQVLTLLGIEAGATGDMSAAEILALLLTVDGAASGLDADLLEGLHASTGGTGNTIAARDTNGDIVMRLPRTTYADQSVISGGMVFRVNNSTDNYLRVCNDPAAIRAFLATEGTANKNVANGYAGLDSNGKILESLLPSLAITDTYEASTEAGMLALTAARTGDICIRSDLNKTYILAADGYATLSNWKELRTPTDTVLSINGKIGVVTLSSADIADSLDKRYVTDSQLAIIAATSGTNTGNETATSIGSMINGATAKATPVDADMIGIMDSAASNILKKVSWANIKATLKTYFDTLYNMYTHPATHPATMITEDATHRFLTDTEQLNWDAAYTHSTSAHAPSTAQKNSDILKSEIEAKLTGDISSHQHSTQTTNLTITTTAPKVQLNDSDGLSRGVMCNGGYLGFLKSSNDWAFRVDDSGNAIAVGDVTAFSDRRLKKDLQAIENALDKITQLTGYTYTRIDSGEVCAGVVAQEVEAVLPEAVRQNSDYLSVSGAGVNALIVQALKELTQKVQELNTRVNNLEQK